MKERSNGENTFDESQMDILFTLLEAINRTEAILRIPNERNGLETRNMQRRSMLDEHQGYVGKMLDILRELKILPESKLIFKLKELHELYGECIFELSYSMLNQTLEKVDGQMKQLDARQYKITRELTSKHVEAVDSAISDIKITERTAIKNIEEKNLQLISDISKQRDDMLALVMKYESRLSESNAKKENELLEAVTKKTNEFSKNVSQVARTVGNDFNNTFNENLQEAENKIDIHVNEFKDVHNEIRGILEVTGGDVLANNNLKQAEKEKKSADRLRFFGTVLLTGLILYTGFEINQLISKTKEINMTFLLVRFLFVFLVTMPGIYLLKESSRHRADERKYRKVGIQLATINAYLDSFSTEDKVHIKQELTTNFFGSGEVKCDISTVPNMQKSFDKMLDAVVAIAKKQK